MRSGVAFTTHSCTCATTRKDFSSHSILIRSGTLRKIWLTLVTILKPNLRRRINPRIPQIKLMHLIELRVLCLLMMLLISGCLSSRNENPSLVKAVSSTHYSISCKLCSLRCRQAPWRCTMCLELRGHQISKSLNNSCRCLKSTAVGIWTMLITPSIKQDKKQRISSPWFYSLINWSCFTTW